MPIVKKPLKTLFEAMFHGKRSFADFMREASEDDLGRTHIRQGAKRRELVSPSERLRAYHSFLRLFLVDFLPVHEKSVFSYRKGVSARAAVEQHAPSRHFFVTDIESFFPSLTRGIVRETITNAMAEIPIADLSDHLEHVLDLLCVDDAVPIGFSTSPGLSNAALYPFDAAFHARCQQLGVIYTRYADDIVLSSGERSAVQEGEVALNELLDRMFRGELRLHRGKSKYLHVGGKIKLLGMVLLPNRTISVDTSVKDEIETMLHLYLRDRERFNKMLEVGSAKTEARLAGLLNYVNTVDQSYLEKLRRKYGAAVVDMFLHRSFG
ncbi:RNA-directed DNA polymerase [Sphaerotilus sulfidivorans]|uniref:RNA-directed DNA polymerase n=1 Tax=Sphaerotilus sulfidivorans TaxID=639200 RepID=A0A5C1Q5T1_9BURK|nr:reverse transcriptase domain-containing protein [Sphaerotilus sulfidivorans]NZD45248.1 RNA-directed DNA polymerase [Sphaerotilus sulfidivorans]QEN02269.1 RNA-directed DNA polymerase [Sphaerotilus sulfidivorans]